MAPPPAPARPITDMMNMPGLGIAAKIMAKYGYRAGEGLGKNNQGITQALVVEKTSRRGGRIINLDKMDMAPEEAEEPSFEWEEEV